MDILQGVNYLYTSNGEQKGPVEGTQLVQLASEGHVLSTDHIWTEGLAEWVPAPTVNQLAPLYQAQAEQEAAAAQQQVQAPRGYVQPDAQAQPERKPTQLGGAPTLARRGKTRPPGERSPLPGSATGRTRPGATTGRSIPGQPGALRPGNVPAARGGIMMPAKKGANAGLLYTFFFLPILFFGAPLAMAFTLTEDTTDAQGATMGLILFGSMALGYVCLLCYTIFRLIYFYRAWSHIQDIPGVARTTPGSALGMLFVPFYNIYWVFNVFPGWATDYNRYLDEKGANMVPRAPNGLYITNLVLCCIGIPILDPFMMGNMCKGINALASHPDLQE